MTISRFKLKLLGPAVQSLSGKSESRKIIRDIAGTAGAHGDPSQVAESVRESLRRELQGAINRDRQRRESWISDAEKRPVLDKLGEPVKDSDGTVVRYLEHKALASHDRNNLTSLELQAKLAGVLQDTATQGATIRAVVLMPSPGDPAAAQPAEPGRLAVEIDLKR